MSGAVLGFDAGTSGLKLVVLDGSGEVLARATEGYRSSYSAEGHAEQDPSDWSAALSRAIVAIDPAVRARISAVAGVGHVPSLVLVEGANVPVRPCLTWQDSRAVAQSAALAEQVGETFQDVGTELPSSPTQLLPKLRWVREREPDVARRVRWALQPKDFLNHYLTGISATDPWSSKGLCDVRTGEPAERLLRAAGWEASICPPAFSPWEALGTVSLERADDLGLRRDVVVATGWTDALGAILAVGAFDSPRPFVVTGTSNIVGTSLPRTMTAHGLYSVPEGPAAPLPLLYGPTQSGGEALLWGARLLGVEVGDLIDLAADADPADLPTFVPYLRGERAPLWRDDLRAIVADVSVRHGRAEVARAIVDGVAFGARHILRAASADDRTAVEVGGVGVDDPRWAAMWASALGRPLRIHRETNLSALGAALLAARASGWSTADAARLRRDPEEYSPVAGDATDRFDRYLDASRTAMEWSSHDDLRH